MNSGRSARSAVAPPVEKDIGNFATGDADNMKFGLTIVREIKDGGARVCNVSFYL